MLCCGGERGLQRSRWNVGGRAAVPHARAEECAGIGRLAGETPPITGQAIVAFIILRDSAGGQHRTVCGTARHVAGPSARLPCSSGTLTVPGPPESRSGTIMRRPRRRDVAENHSAAVSYGRTPIVDRSDASRSGVPHFMSWEASRAGLSGTPDRRLSSVSDSRR
ncbi:hypothetical protein GCM10018787_25310 [Streptomyces thermodiastaticus]|nr:hypothetical protein GCM10018787_25310 [Streptomyces thermodiastaticus]